MNLRAKDCLPLTPQPKGGEVDWLRRLALAAVSNVVPLASARDDDEPIVSCDPSGTWRAGRYIGTLLFEGSQLTIEPRFGIEALCEWLSAATNVALVEAPGRLRDDASFVTRLLAAVWGRAFAQAARHGLPALNEDVITIGRVVRGRLDVAATVPLVMRDKSLASRQRSRSLDHACSRALVAAYGVLRRSLGNDNWLPPRLRDLIPQLVAVTGARPPVPSVTELDRVRYTPITAGFGPVARLSRRIATRRGIASDTSSEGSCQGLLLDVAELWELYVLAVLRLGLSWDVTHGTQDISATGPLLRSAVDSSPLGLLRPDAVVSDRNRVVAIVDAKYKQLHPTDYARHGPQREDLYQLAAYLSHYSDARGCLGVLAYPFDPARPETPQAEARNPWRLDDTTDVMFITLPHDRAAASEKIRVTFAASALRSVNATT